MENFTNVNDGDAISVLDVDYYIASGIVKHIDGYVYLTNNEGVVFYKVGDEDTIIDGGLIYQPLPENEPQNEAEHQAFLDSEKV